MDLAGKLQLKPGQSVSIVNAPADVALHLGSAHRAVDDPGEADAVIVFCTDRAELGELRDQFVPPAARDALTWIAYPKSGNLGTDLNRDVLAELVKREAVRPVRQVALDDVWSALRLRPA
ncbi:MAG TPA: hypothetical protein VMJ65_20745 [Solirubrobacteraceae bacterium]|nr:hypothetical protein [Solirubrobacteraceae bacterium]